jgi:hypothetical protein
MPSEIGISFTLKLALNVLRSIIEVFVWFILCKDPLQILTLCAEHRFETKRSTRGTPSRSEGAERSETSERRLAIHFYLAGLKYFYSSISSIELVLRFGVHCNPDGTRIINDQSIGPI